MTASRCALHQTQPSFSAKLIVPVAELIESSSPQVVSVGRYAGTSPGRTSYDRTELHLTPPDCFVPMWNRMHVITLMQPSPKWNRPYWACSI
jgi:hypothetical protein